MPIINVNASQKLSVEKKQDLMEFFAQTVCAHTSTLPKNIYVYLHELDASCCRKAAPTAIIDWTMMPDRSLEAKKKIMSAFTDKLAEVYGEEHKQEIVIIFNDIPLANAMLGGETRAENPSK